MLHGDSNDLAPSLCAISLVAFVVAVADQLANTPLTGPKLATIDNLALREYVNPLAAGCLSCSDVHGLLIETKASVNRYDLAISKELPAQVAAVLLFDRLVGRH